MSLLCHNILKTLIMYFSVKICKNNTMNMYLIIKKLLMFIISKLIPFPQQQRIHCKCLNGTYFT
jgi:hypothetical protein